MYLTCMIRENGLSDNDRADLQNEDVEEADTTLQHNEDQMPADGYGARIISTIDGTIIVRSMHT